MTTQPTQEPNPEDKANVPPQDSTAAEAKADAPPAANENSAGKASAAEESAEDKTEKTAVKRAPEIMVVDDEEHLLKIVSTALSDHGMVVHTAKSGEEGLEKFRNSMDLLLVDLKMPGMDGIQFITTIRQRGWQGKVMILTAFPSRDSIMLARKLHISDYLSKPIKNMVLVDRVEEILEFCKQINELELPEEQQKLIMDNKQPLALFAPGELQITAEMLKTLPDQAPELLEQKALVPSRDYYSVNDVQKPGDLTSREPTLKKGQPVEKAAVKAMARLWRDRYAGIVEQSGTPVQSILVERNKEIGNYLVLKIPVAVDNESFASRLKSNELCAYVLNGLPEEKTNIALTALGDACRHHEVAFFLYELKAKDNRQLMVHSLGAAFLSAMHASAELERKEPGIDADKKRQILAMVAVCGILHDLGLKNMDTDIQFASKVHLETWKKHAMFGFELLKESTIYKEVKIALRDHHKVLLKRCSKFDCLSKIVEMVSDLDSIVQGQEIIAGRNEPEPKRTSASLVNACREMLARAKRSFYSEREVEVLLSDLAFNVLVNYYRSVKNIEERPCKSILFSPNGVNPVTALCKFGPPRVSKFSSESFCDGVSGHKNHSFKENFYHRCLRAHEEITELNQSIKHLGSQLDASGKDAKAGKGKNHAKDKDAAKDGESDTAKAGEKSDNPPAEEK